MCRNQFLVLSCFSSVLLAFGCASKGFNRGELKQQVGVIRPSFDEKEIQDAFSKKPNLPKPFKIAVYFTQPKPAKGASNEWRWTDGDKASFDELGKMLRNQGLVSDIFPIVSSLLVTEDLKSLRLLAAKHHADALLVISGAAEIDRYTNDAAWSYLLLVPALFVKGAVAETLMVTTATMWDVRNEYLYLTAEAEGISRKTYAVPFEPKEEALVNEAKTNSLVRLNAEIKKMIEGTKL